MACSHRRLRNFRHLTELGAVRQTPDQVVAERLTAKPTLAKAKPSGRAGPGDIIKARLIAENAKEVSQPDRRLDCMALFFKF